MVDNKEKETKFDKFLLNKLSRDFRASLINSLTNPLFVKGRDHRFIVVNDAFCDFTNLPREKIIGKTDFFFMKDSEVEKYWQIDESILNTGQTYKNEVIFEVEGEKRVISTTKTRFVLNNKKYVVGNVLDITEIKSLELELAEKNTQLQKYINSNDELERFAYYASHDLKSPLQNIVNYSSLLKDTIASKLSEQESTCLGFILNGAKRMHQTVEDLLSFSFSVNKKVVLTKVDFMDLLNEVKLDLEILIKDKAPELNINSITTLVNCDRGSIKNVIQNLLSNAIKFTPKDRKPIIDIHCEEKMNEFVFRISDNGVGIPPNKFDQIFEIFSRLHSQNEFEGTGIGLSFCKKVIEKHNGKIWLESKINEGTTFFFSLPTK